MLFSLFKNAPNRPKKNFLGNVGRELPRYLHHSQLVQKGIRTCVQEKKAHLRCNVVFTVTLACTKRVLFITKIKRAPLVFEKHWGGALCLPVPTPLPEFLLRGTGRQLK